MLQPPSSFPLTQQSKNMHNNEQMQKVNEGARDKKRQEVHGCFRCRVSLLSSASPDTAGSAASSNFAHGQWKQHERADPDKGYHCAKLRDFRWNSLPNTLMEVLPQEIGPHNKLAPWSMRIKGSSVSLQPANAVSHGTELTKVCYCLGWANEMLVYMYARMVNRKTRQRWNRWLCLWNHSYCGWLLSMVLATALCGMRYGSIMKHFPFNFITKAGKNASMLTVRESTVSATNASIHIQLTGSLNLWTYSKNKTNINQYSTHRFSHSVYVHIYICLYTTS